MSGGGNVTVEHRWYAPLQRPALLVHEIEIHNAGAEEATIAMGGAAGPDTCSEECRRNAASQRAANSADLNLHPITNAPAGVYGMVGTNKIALAI